MWRLVAGAAALALCAGCTAGSSATVHRASSSSGSGGGLGDGSSRTGPGPTAPTLQGPGRQAQPPDPRRQVGTSAWKLTKPAHLHGLWRAQIEGYADPLSVLPGQRAALMVQTSAPSFRVQAYRIGGYRGGTGRLVWASGRLARTRQPAPSLVARTRMVVAHWHASTMLDTGRWPPGFYLLKLTASTGFQSYVPFTVRSPTTAGRIVLSAPVMDWQAYNGWGGYDLYRAPVGRYRSYAVSFDRPFTAGGPASGARLFVDDAVPVAAFAERLGLPLAYETDVDVASRPALLAGAAGYVTLGHDEYWTVPERRYVTAARDAGTNLAFLSSNTMYWRVRLAAARTGPDRVMVAYKSDAAAADPMRTRRPALTTARWRDPPRPDPENSLTGTLYECFPVDVAYRVASPRWWGFRGTGVHRGQRVSAPGVGRGGPGLPGAVHAPAAAGAVLHPLQLQRGRDIV